MIFKHTWQQVLDGTKTQTRRLVKPGEKCLDGKAVSRTWARAVLGITGHRIWEPYYPRWTVGHIYAVQPGPGKKAIGRIRITAIHRERLQDISEAGALAEGCKHYSLPRLHIGAFAELWDSLYNKPGTRWADNPEVWVLEYKLLEAGE